MTFDQLATFREKSYLSDKIYHHKSNLLNTAISGYGSSFNLEVSIIKSINECVERFYFKNYFISRGHITSNGLAASSSKSMSTNSASCELLERHILLTHWFQKITPYWLKRSDYDCYINSTDHVFCLNQAYQKGYVFHFGILGIINNVYVAVSAVKKNNDTGYAISTAADTNLAVSVVKCFEDAIRVIDLLESRIHFKTPLFEIISEDQIKKPTDHLEYYLNPDNWKSQDWFFENNENIREYKAVNLSIDTIVDTEICGYPIFISCAKNNLLQKLFFGKTDFEKLSDSNKLEIKNLCPHPLA
jgi:YcaO cyclodehydratase, ATP-ad Mg2+-binding